MHYQGTRITPMTAPYELAGLNFCVSSRLLAFAPDGIAVIPGEIDTGPQMHGAFISDRPLGERGAPVWHMDE